MSTNIRGITFAEQTVTPADDAIVRRAILSDGILSGCDITYSGSTLTMAAGFVIACGRCFQITAARNWAVVDATTGFARLVLTIDLTKTATETTFDQISFGIEYASAENGFVDLTQEDINIAGTRYQVSVAVVSLGAGGITGIVSRLEKAEGGGGVNFKVVPGMTQPGTATENTIWVMTEKITGYYFSSTQPENMQEGEVWIATGLSSAVEFNALRKNALQVYPRYVRQMVSNLLTDVTAMIYQGGQWVDLATYLYKAGNEFTDLTGGWLVTQKSGATSTKPPLTKGADGMSIDCPSSGTYSGNLTHPTAVDLTESQNLYVNVSGLVLGASSAIKLRLNKKADGNREEKYVVNGGIIADGVASVDVSALEGEFYVMLYNYSPSGSALSYIVTEVYHK